VNIVLSNVTSCCLVDYYEDRGSRFFLDGGAVYKTASYALIIIIIIIIIYLLHLGLHPVTVVLP
jgi:hypothetical protein